MRWIISSAATSAPCPPRPHRAQEPSGACHFDGQGSLPAFTPVSNCSSISTRYPLASLFVSFAIPTTAISSANMASVMPALRAAAVCDAMQ